MSDDPPIPYNIACPCGGDAAMLVTGINARPMYAIQCATCNRIPADYHSHRGDALKQWREQA